MESFFRPEDRIILPFWSGWHRKRGSLEGVTQNSLALFTAVRSLTYRWHPWESCRIKSAAWQNTLAGPWLWKSFLKASQVWLLQPRNCCAATGSCDGFTATWLACLLKDWFRVLFRSTMADLKMSLYACVWTHSASEFTLTQWINWFSGVKIAV